MQLLSSGADFASRRPARLTDEAFLDSVAAGEKHLDKLSKRNGLFYGLKHCCYVGNALVNPPRNRTSSVTVRLLPCDCHFSLVNVFHVESSHWSRHVSDSNLKTVLGRSMRVLRLQLPVAAVLNGRFGDCNSDFFVLHSHSCGGGERAVVVELHVGRRTTTDCCSHCNRSVLVYGLRLVLRLNYNCRRLLHVDFAVRRLARAWDLKCFSLQSY